MPRHKAMDPENLDRPDWNSLKKNYSKHDVGEAYLVGRLHQMGLHTEHWGIDMRDHDDHLIFDNKMDLRLWEPIEGQDEPPDQWPGEVTTPPDVSPTNRHPIYRYETAVTEDPSVIEAARSHPGVDVHDEFETANWELRGLVDVKTKANEDWLGVTNLRHFSHYAQWADRYDAVPTMMYFTMVDMDDETVGERNIVIPVPTDWPFERAAAEFDDSGEADWDALRECIDECDTVRNMFAAPDGNCVVRFEEQYWENFDYLVENVL